jgi:transposase-like protein
MREIPDWVADAVAGYKAGESLSRLSARLGVSVSAIHWRLRQCGIRMRPSGTRMEQGRLISRDEMRSAAAAMYRDGSSIRYISKKLAITRKSAGKLLREVGALVERNA